MNLPGTRRWVLVAVVAFLLHATLSFTLKQGYALTVCGDLLQTVALFSVAALALRNMRQSGGKARIFWGLISAGFVTWSISQFLWTYIEVVQRRDVPDPFAGDIVLFFHVVPIMAALVMRPHRKAAVHKTYLPAIDFALLMLWWVYLYIFVVIPPQYVEHDTAQYGNSFTALYVTENAALLVALAVLWLTAQNDWRKTYKHLFLAGTVYMVSSQAINTAISANRYYTGSLFDLPLFASLLWFMWVTAVRPEQTSSPSSYSEARAFEDSVPVSRLAMGAILSIPLLASWSIFFSVAPQHVRMFRLAVSLIAILVLAMVMFMKQMLLDHERTQLLKQAEDNIADMKRLHAQLLQSEKLAALGQLVSGAAHEINNPLTAILGYAELLSTDPSVTEVAREHGRKIKQQTRRTKELVTSMLRFAQQSAGAKTLVNLNGVVESSLQLRSVETGSAKDVTVVRELQPNLGWVWGDSRELIEVCLQLIGNAQEAAHEVEGSTVTVRTRQVEKTIVLEVLDGGRGIADPQKVFDPFYSTKSQGKKPGLGLSACYGIVRAHGGEIHCENRLEGGARFEVRLPCVSEEASPKSASAHN